MLEFLSGYQLATDRSSKNHFCRIHSQMNNRVATFSTVSGLISNTNSLCNRELLAQAYGNKVLVDVGLDNGARPVPHEGGQRCCSNVEHRREGRVSAEADRRLITDTTGSIHLSRLFYYHYCKRFVGVTMISEVDLWPFSPKPDRSSVVSRRIIYGVFVKGSCTL